MTTNTDTPNTTRKVTWTGAITLAHTGRPVEIITMVPASEVHKCHKPTTRNDDPRNDLEDKVTKKNKDDIEDGV